jgi:hypothetical protein
VTTSIKLVSSNFDVLFVVEWIVLRAFDHNVSGFPLSFTVSEKNLTERGHEMQISKIWKFLFFIWFWCSFFVKCSS